MNILFKYKKEMHAFACISFFFLLLPAFAPAAPDRFDPARTLDELLVRARSLALHKDRYWRILLHYRETLSGVESLIDDPAFFLAPNGKTDSPAELEATLRALFGRENTTDDLGCRFMARYYWLREKLNPDPGAFPPRPCPSMEAVTPRSATLVFPTYFLNNPASMFGHTLIHIKTDYESDLMSKAVNYAAFTNETNGFVYAFRGIFGYYKGFYSVMPYYKKLQEYSDMNQRDIWEYELNLTPEELSRMIRHIRELENIFSFYYFFDENCSYNLLYLLEAARPSLHLTDRFPFVTLPIDTVKVLKGQDVIRSVDFRPAKVTNIRHQTALLSPRQLDLAEDLIEGRIAPEDLLETDLSHDDRIQVLDTVIEFIRFRYYKRKMDLDAYQKRLIEALKVRSRMGQTSTALPPVPEPPRPDASHALKRFTLGFGHGKGGPYWEIGVRPLIGDLLDTDYVANDGIQIEFLDLNLRNDPDDHRTRLEHLDLIDVVSIFPADRLLKPWSWKVRAGVYRRFLPDGRNTLTGRLNIGIGMAVAHPVLGLPYVMLEAQADTCGDLKQDVSASPVLAAGTLVHLIRDWKCHLEFRSAYLGMEGGYAYYEGRIAQHVGLNRDSRIRCALEWEKLREADDLRSIVSWDLFF